MGQNRQVYTNILRGLLLVFLLCLDNSASDFTATNEGSGSGILPDHVAIEDNPLRIIMPRIIVDDTVDRNVKITVNLYSGNDSSFFKEFEKRRANLIKVEDYESMISASSAEVLNISGVVTPADDTENGTSWSFICSNISMKVDEYRLASDSVRIKNLMLKVSNITRSGDTITVCKPIIEDKIIVKYPTVMGVVVSSIVYTSVSLVCAFACIISVPKFIVLFISSNIITYFLVCVLLTGSVSDVLVYFIPIHLNYMFFLVTGWVTLLSCKVVFMQLKAHKILRVINGDVVGNACPMYELILTFSCFLPFITLLGNRPIPDEDLTLKGVESMYFHLMAHLTPTVIFLLLTVLLVDVVFTSQRKKIHDLGVSHIRYYLTFFCYHTFAMVAWVYGFIVVSLSTYPQFWRLYLFVSIVLPLFYIKDVIVSTRVKFLLQVVQPGNNDEIFRIRVQQV